MYFVKKGPSNTNEIPRYPGLASMPDSTHKGKCASCRVLANPRPNIIFNLFFAEYLLACYVMSLWNLCLVITVLV